MDLRVNEGNHKKDYTQVMDLRVNEGNHLLFMMHMWQIVCTVRWWYKLGTVSDCVVINGFINDYMLHHEKY